MVSHEPELVDAAAGTTPATDLVVGAQPGLAALHEVLAHVVERLGLDALTVVVDDPDLGRQAFRAGTGPFPPGALVGAPGCRAEPPLPPGGVDAELLVALCAASLRVEVLRGDGVSGPDAAELALRSLPGVHAVAVERESDLVIVQLLAGPDAPPDLSRLAARAARPLHAGTVVVELTHDGGDRPAAATAPGRRTGGDAPAQETVAASPQIVAVRSVPESGEIEVHVRGGDMRTIGRAPMAQGLAGAVAAVIDALSPCLPGLDLGYSWARTIETTADRRFVVAVGLHRTGTGTSTHGLGSGSSPIEAAARAALDAATRPDDPT